MNAYWLLFLVGATAAVASRLALGNPCGEIGDDAERLACYDAQYQAEQAAERAEDSALATETSSTPQTELLPRFQRLRSAWLRHINSTGPNAERAVVLSTRSNERVACEEASGKRAALHIRCKDNTTSLYLVSDCALASIDAAARVEWQVDDQSPQTLQMTKPSSEPELGLWLGKHSIPLVRELFDANEVRIELESDQEEEASLVFPVLGLEAAIGPLRKACHW